MLWDGIKSYAKCKMRQGKTKTKSPLKIAIIKIDERKMTNSPLVVLVVRSSGQLYKMFHIVFRFLDCFICLALQHIAHNRSMTEK